MGDQRGFFTNELFQHYLQFDKAIPDGVQRLLDKNIMELRGDEVRTYKRMIAPNRGTIKEALRDRWLHSNGDEYRWPEHLPDDSPTIIEQLAAELLMDMGVSARRQVAPFQIDEIIVSTPAARATAPAGSTRQSTTAQADQRFASPLPSEKASGRGAKPVYKTVLNILYWAFLALMCLLVVLLVLSLFNLGIQAFAVSSSSMSPTIKAGSVVFIRSSDEYQPGDVVTFLGSEDEYITHRIEEIRTEEGNELYVTKGDANEDVDPYQTRLGDIKGKVVLDLPYLGYAVAFFRTRAGFVMIMCLFGLIMVSLIFEIMKAYPSRKRQMNTGPNPD